MNPSSYPADVLDMALSLEQVGDDPELLEQLVATFLGQLPRLLPPIEIAVGLRDAKAIRQSAHALCSSVSIIAAARVRDNARELETMGARDQLQGIDRVHARLVEEVRTLVDALNASYPRKAA